jgi:hypothetical protein
MNIAGLGILQESMRCLAPNLHTEASTKHTKNGEFVREMSPKGQEYLTSATILLVIEKGSIYPGRKKRNCG